MDKGFDILDVILAKSLAGGGGSGGKIDTSAQGVTSLIVTDGAGGSPVESLKVTFDETVDSITVVYNGRQLVIGMISGGSVLTPDHGILDVIQGTLTVDDQVYPLDGGGQSLSTVKGENIITVPSGMVIDMEYKADLALYVQKPARSMAFTTIAPTKANTDGLKIVVLTAEPETKYDGYIYFIKES